jgi:hypothetical protein
MEEARLIPSRKALPWAPLHGHHTPIRHGSEIKVVITCMQVDNHVSRTHPRLMLCSDDDNAALRLGASGEVTGSSPRMDRFSNFGD